MNGVGAGGARAGELVGEWSGGARGATRRGDGGGGGAAAGPRRGCRPRGRGDRRHRVVHSSGTTRVSRCVESAGPSSLSRNTPRR